jgi:hypothetical protein
VELLVTEDLKVMLVLTVIKVTQDQPVESDHKVIRVIQDSLDQLVLKEIQVLKVTQVLWGHKGLQDHKVP